MLLIWLNHIKLVSNQIGIFENLKNTNFFF